MEILTNAAPAIGMLALLLNPTSEPNPAEDVIGSDPAAEITMDHLFGDWGGPRTNWSEHGFDVTVQYIGEVEGNVSGGVKRGTVYNGLLNVTGDVNLEKALGWQGGRLHGAMLVPHGRSLTDHYVHDLFVLSNLDASDYVHLFELWLEQEFKAGKISFRLGQLAVDQEFAFTERGALFASAAFGWFPIAGNNVTAPVYPQGAPGLRGKWQTSERSYVQFAVVDGDVNPTDQVGNETNPNGIEFRFDEGAFIIAETGLNWQLGSEVKPGSLKAGAWYHTADTAHIRWDDLGQSLADPLTSGTPKSYSGNWGVYIAVEQGLWKENPENQESSQGFGCFGRFGYAPSDRNLLVGYAEVGLTSTGLLPGRDTDVCGLAIAYGRIGNDTRGLFADDNFFNAAAAVVPDHELAIECTYRWNVHPGFAIQPGAQYIIHPGGSSAIDNAFVLSLRTSLDF